MDKSPSNKTKVLDTILFAASTVWYPCQPIGRIQDRWVDPLEVDTQLEQHTPRQANTSSYVPSRIVMTANLTHRKNRAARQTHTKGRLKCK